MTAEHVRLEEARQLKASWKKWGPYLSERQWGTVREDYSADGNAWDYFSHDQARSRAYRWGEDGLAGVSDDKQRVCFALALWNGRDPILKERLFGLTNSQGNHGEDVKEYYFYLDSTPTHSYMKYLYKYPHAPYPYDDLVATNGSRGRGDMEYELIDTGVFDENRYFDVFVEYAKGSPEDLLVEITVHNRGPETASLHVLPTIWFRNIWSSDRDALRPELFEIGDAHTTIALTHASLGHLFFHAEGATELLFTENDTNNERLFNGRNPSPYVKDGINDFIVHGRREAVNPKKTGTKASAHYPLTLAGGGSHVLRLRLSDAAPPVKGSAKKASPGTFSKDFDAVMSARRREADEFYQTVIPASLKEDQARVMRQALGGMLWTKQFFHYDVDEWLEERGADPFKPTGHATRNQHWHHMHNADIISMPDKWEYPWYAAWDLAFHSLALTLVDEDFGKQQLDLMLREDYLHPNGQIPAYEWNFGDVNPPVHAWATIFTHRLMKSKQGEGDIEWLERSFHKLLLNFTWWVNRKDPGGRNAFEGGFLGLDNIGVFDRSSPLPTGGYLEQADGTAWMALFCQNMLEIAIELAMQRPAYAEMCDKFLAHFLWIAMAMTHAGEGAGMWDEEDGFFYDVLKLPDGRSTRLKVRSMVGLLPLCAATTYDGKILTKYPEVANRVKAFLEARPELRESIHDPLARGVADRRLASVLDESKLRRVLSRMLDEGEFLSAYGIRALSRHHAEDPYKFLVGDQEYGVGYLPAESDSGMFGGNSNWRGPIWMPVNGLIIRALLQYYAYYGNEFKIECPTGSGQMMTLYQVAEEITRRLSSIFLRDEDGRRPVYGGTEKFQDDPHWRDLILFYEYFHGDNGAGLGASHQTGWTGIVARAMHLFATDKIASIVLARRTPLWWYGGFLVAGAGSLMLLVSLVHLVQSGIGIWGNNQPIGWAFDITNFVWWIGIGHAGTLISAILLLLKQTWRTSINRFAEAMTLFAVACAGIFPLFHTGRPWLAYWLLPYPNTMNVWPQFKSPLVWDVFAVSTYGTVSLLFWYVGLIPDLATLRDRSQSRTGRVIYGMLAMGWRGSARHWHRYEIAYLLLAGLATPLVVSVHTVVSFDFAVSVLPGWHATIFPPYFVAGAIYSGFAMVLTLVIPVRALYRLDDFITTRHLDNMAKVLLVTGLIVAYGYTIEAFTAWYSANPYEGFMIWNRITGPYWWAYTLLILCNVVTPQVLWFRRVRATPLALFIVAIIVNVGMWLERFVIIVTSLHRDFMPSAWGRFSPTIWDWTTYFGTIGLFLTLLFLFLRFLPMISIFEMRTLLPEAKVAEE